MRNDKFMDLRQILSQPEQQVLWALHFAGASPREQPLKANRVLIVALQRANQWSPEAEAALGRCSTTTPIVNKWDEILIGLVCEERAGRQLVHSRLWGNWGTTGPGPCHPNYRECQLSLEGQRLVVERIDTIPRTLADPELGSLVWNPNECWWQGAIDWQTRRLPLCVYQIVPGSPFQLEASRRTLRGALRNEPNIQRAILVEARLGQITVGSDCDSACARPLTLKRIVLRTDGGGRLEYELKTSPTYEVDVRLDQDGNWGDPDIYGPDGPVYV